MTLDTLSQQDKDSQEITNDAELHQWIVENLGVDIPRVACCPGHDAPFDLVADLFFNRVSSAILVANRGGGKTATASLWHFLNMRFVPQVECISVGAQDIQSKRAYAHFKKYQRKAARQFVDTSLMSETIWIGGEKYEILTGSIGSVNGPHVPKVHRDEVDLMDKQVYQESLQIEKSARDNEGNLIPIQSLITSTRKSTDGLMQELIDNSKVAVQAGRKAAHKIYMYCIKETIENQPTCRVAFPDLPDEEKCECHTIQNGEFSEGEPRTFDKVCGGLLAKAQGFTPIEDAHQTFITSSKAMWDAQQECKRPYSEDITLEEFDRERHGIREFEPDPDNGMIFMSADIGAAVPHAVEWGQVLDYEIEVKGYNNQPKRLRPGTIVVFDEIYIAEIGNQELADLIIDTEREYKKRYPKFRVRGRFVDPQAKITRLDFKRHDPPLFCTWPAITREREEHLKRLYPRVRDDYFAVSLDRSPMFIEEVEVWNINENRKKFDHAVDSVLYLVSNIHMLIDSGEQNKKRTATPGINQKTVRTMPAVKLRSPEQELFAEDQQWRRKFGS